MSVSEEIKNLRKKLRYSQDEFANLVGVSQTAVSQYELGQRQPSLSVVKKLIKFAKANKMKIKLFED